MERRKARPLGIAAAAVLLLLGLQLLQPPPPRGSLPGDGRMTDFVEVPEEVHGLLREACYDCHSARTRWPWYARISPVSWLIADDVRHGRSNLDFSRWSTDPFDEPTPEQRLTWTCRDVREGTMPPKLYLLLHPGARLDEREVEAICAWSAEAVRALGGGSRPRTASPRRFSR